MTVVINGDTGITQAGEFDSDSTMGFKNRIINGAMVIDQRNAGASVTPTATGTYLVDRFNSINSQASKFSAQQSTTVPAGFKNSLVVTSLSAYTVGASETFGIRQLIEGFNVADLGWGAVGATTVTLSFWVRSSLTGTFGGTITNNSANRFYPFSYTISSPNTWEQKSITIPGDTTGTWLTDTSAGISVSWSLGTGSTLSGSAGSWGATAYYGITSAQSIVGTNGATFYITGVQLEKGSTATSFDYRPYGTELALCQRYLPVTTGTYSGFFINSTTGYIAISFPVSTRTAPTGITRVGTASTVLNTSASGIALTAMTFNSAKTESGFVNVSTAGSMTAAQGTLLVTNGDSIQWTGCEL